MTAVPANERVARAWIAQMNRQAVDRLEASLAPEPTVRVTPFGYVLRSRDEFVAFLLDLFDAFPDLWIRVRAMVTDRDRVGVRADLTASAPAGVPTLGIGARGPFRAPMGAILRLSDRRITDAWIVLDLAGPLRDDARSTRGSGRPCTSRSGREHQFSG